MSSQNPPRRPKGTPIGGQFAPSNRSEADIDLGQAAGSESFVHVMVDGRLVPMSRSEAAKHFPSEEERLLKYVREKNPDEAEIYLAAGWVPIKRHEYHRYINPRGREGGYYDDFCRAATARGECDKKHLSFDLEYVTWIHLDPDAMPPGTRRADISPLTDEDWQGTTP